MNARALSLLVASAATVAMQGPAQAQSTAAATGIAAGLGLTAASDKTTLSSGAGGIEASLLASDAVLAAGADIRARAAAIAGDRPVLVLGRSDTVDLTSAVWVSMRIQGLTRALNGLTGDRCTPRPPPPRRVGPPAAPVAPAAAAAAGPSLGLSDITAALKTDVTISPISISEDDRVLVNAVANPRLTSVSTSSASEPWTNLQRAPGQGRRDTFFVPGEIVNVASGQTVGILHDYNRLQDLSFEKAAACSTPEAKAAVSDVADFVKSVSSSSKGQAPIMLAAELAGFNDPLVLRVAIEQVGGTAITRANIWYSIGFPGAATVSSGLLASYRLVEPESGAVRASGLVRCMTEPVDIQAVKASLSTATRQVCQATSPSP